MKKKRKEHCVRYFEQPELVKSIEQRILERKERRKPYDTLMLAKSLRKARYEAFMNDKTPAPEMDVPSSIYSYDIRLTPKVINAGIGGKSYRKRSQFKVFKKQS